ncbi:hypothetical protein GobsT_44390 [Gemmata obscuriglobus]|uniref:Uncharacterized protein n=1 Tax=Gemmata obscuriglobus TaxID=114 RepID=A0A2Z3H7C6_9BACT|nr:hypothetical protein [Gemmata obscuriglobus]AWM37574.1 hypothetical protein C1280_11515 [Gemmata obscuriglobus]QEG29641.1 hypothetical protein GobsT_44390 [Gemmata obscuriglobus]VTS08958.1 unnamed protein product [Gemmata obscuriglobus UQM 2246]
MEVCGELQLGPTDFRVLIAWFAPVAGGGWDFHFYAHCTNEADAAVFPYGVALVAEGAPVPQVLAVDYTGVRLVMPEARYPDSGQSWFGLWVGGEHETWHPELRFAARDGARYRVEFASGTSFEAGGAYLPLRLSTWAEARPPRSGPATVWGVWPRGRWR